ncbi:hypothetical protein EAI_15668 [Harpegnathos saltator]|uniref:Uncharacterized protein n=1 Tax=Harpegnathos saltator TaxID=610380 RepID=E2BQN8_HARSA|nr:hypothetical protein EAI_15668 [Harpegnathos saltator]
MIHDNAVLGESNPVIVAPGFKESLQIYNVKFAVELPLMIEDRGSVDSLISTPVLSERSHTERLIVETASLALDANAISWQNLPVLTVTITYDDAEIFPADAKINFLSVTVESIHNPPAFFAEDEEYRAGTIVYVDNESPENLIFRNGMWTKCRSTEKTKRWQSLSKLQSRARLSKYKLNRDYTDIKDTLSVKLNLEDKALRDEPRIEWNSMNRKVIYDAGLLMMQKHINEYIFLKKKLLEWRRPAEVRGVVITKHLLHRYKYWPFQFLTVEKSSEDDEVESKTERPAKRRLYQCYIDMSELLLPGKTSTRVVAQLHSHGPSDMLEKTGLERNIFVDPRNEDLGERERKNHALENFVASTYTYLVERMHSALNKIVESRLTSDYSPRITICPNLYFYAEEAHELGHTDDARRHHQAFAGIALAEEMSRVGRATHVLYYLAVQHYVSRRYENALSHLQEARRTYGMDYSISGLMGHCHFQRGDFEEAVRCYEFASTVSSRPGDLHLVRTR